MDEIKEAAKIINQATKPLILVGQGITLSNAEEEVLKLAEISNTPIASTLLGLSAVKCDHPLYVGYLGMHGNYGPNIKTNECDVLLAIGMRFDDRVTGDLKTYAKQAKILHFEIDPSEINKNKPAHIPIVCDVKDALQQLLPLMEYKDEIGDWRTQCQHWKQENPLIGGAYLVLIYTLTISPFHHYKSDW